MDKNKFAMINGAIVDTTEIMLVKPPKFVPFDGENRYVIQIIFRNGHVDEISTSVKNSEKLNQVYHDLQKTLGAI